MSTHSSSYTIYLRTRIFEKILSKNYTFDTLNYVFKKILSFFHYSYFSGQ